MHEMSIAEGMFTTILDVAEENNATSIEEIEIEVGEMRLVVPEALEMAFEVLARGTMMEGAKVTIIEKPIVAECNRCKQQFSARIDMYRCPACGHADNKIIEGNDIILTSLVCETDDDGDER